MAIQRRTREINVELAGRSEPIEMHVGVNSVRGLGGCHEDRRAGGRPVDLHRVGLDDERRRPAGRAVGGGRRDPLGGDLAAGSAPACRTQDLGFRELKNVPQPMRVHRIDVGAYLASAND